MVETDGRSELTHATEKILDQVGRRQQPLEILYGRALFRTVWSAAAPQQELQALHRPLLRREGRDVVGLYLNPPDAEKVQGSPMQLQ